MAACNFNIPQHLCTLETCCLEQGTIRYAPTVAGNLIYMLIFLAILIAQIGLAIRYRTWGFLTGMFCGVSLEVCGYAGRLWMHSNVFDMNGFLMYLVCLTIGPAFLSASIYLCLSRIVNVYGANLSRLSPKAYTLTFISCDIVSLLFQAAGGAIASLAGHNRKQADMGAHIMVAGLVFQVLSLLLFMASCAEFALRVRQAPHGWRNSACADLTRTKKFRGFLAALTISTVCIFIRSVYRVAELQSGFGSKLANDQVSFMILEGPMVIVGTFALTAFHPGVCLRGQWTASGWSIGGEKAQEPTKGGTSLCDMIADGPYK